MCKNRYPYIMASAEQQGPDNVLQDRHDCTIDWLIYIGKHLTYLKNWSALVRQMFDEIGEEGRIKMLNNLIRANRFEENGLDDLMKVLEKASVEYKKIAYMLLGVKDKSLVARMIDWISIKHGDKYVVDILMSIDDDNDLGNMISGLKDLPILILKILNGADEVGKLSRLFNIIKSSGISEEEMETVLDKLVINKNIVSELIDKPEDEQNKILGRINSAQLADKIIKCAIKEVQAQANLIAKQEAQAERREEHVKLIAAEEQKRRMLETTAILIILLVALITRMSIKDALNN